MDKSTKVFKDGIYRYYDNKDVASCMILTSMANIKNDVAAWEKQFRICMKITTDKKRGVNQK